MAIRRGKDLRRKRGSLPEQKRILIYCEGRVTERRYFSALIKKYRVPGVRLGSEHGEPLRLVTAAIDHKRRVPYSDKDQHQEYDEVWCVLDVEAPKPQPSLDRALELARRHGVNCAVSNPCFELWLILHLADHSGYLTTNKACELLEKHGACCGYRRDGKDFRPDPLLQHYDVARRRAWRLAENHEAGKRLTDRNPFTSVWLLADRLIAQNGARP